MMSIQPTTPGNPSLSATLALGFRPFFTLAAVAGVTLIATWLAMLAGLQLVPARLSSHAWHAHEMLFGYTSAVIAGFLLTAVRNWNGIHTWSGYRLGLLAGVWLLGRLLPWIDGLPMLAWSIVDIAFLPLLGYSLARPLWLGKNHVNRVFLLLLGLMALANLLSHLQQQGLLGEFGRASHLMLLLVLMLVLLVAGRVLPFFTRNVIAGFQPVTRRWVEVLGFLLLAALIAVELFRQTHTPVAAALWLAVTAAQLFRFNGWFDRRVLRLPVLWVLHAGYAWLIIGSALNGLSSIGGFPASPATHALAVGAIGVFTLGMMARVSRGHSGRPLNVSRITAGAFLLLNLAAVVRVFGPAILPQHLSLWLQLSGAGWCLAFALFAWHYIPMLIRPRTDGKPG